MDWLDIAGRWCGHTDTVDVPVPRAGFECAVDSSAETYGGFFGLLGCTQRTPAGTAGPAPADARHLYIYRRGCGESREAG